MNRRDAIKAIAAIPFVPEISSNDVCDPAHLGIDGPCIRANWVGGRTVAVKLAKIADCQGFGFGQLAYGNFIATGKKCCLIKNDAENTWWVVAAEES